MKLKYIPLLILCSCSSDPVMEQLPADDEISLHSGIGTISAVQTRGGGIVSGTLTADLPVTFVRVDKPSGGSYPANYTGVGLLPAIITQTNKIIAFESPQYYPADGGSTKFVGWYPATGSSAWNAGTRTVTFPVLDGTTDVLVSSTVEGSKSSLFTAAQNRITFKHILTQVQVFAYLENVAYATLWGNLTEIALVNKAQTFTLLLPVPTVGSGASPTANFAASTTALLLQKLNNTGAIASQTLSANVPNTETGTPLGYAMFAPHTADTDKLTLKVTTEKGGSQYIEIPYSNMRLEAGKSYSIVLKFQATRIEPTAIITDWVTAPSGEQPNPIGIG